MTNWLGEFTVDNWGTNSIHNGSRGEGNWIGGGTRLGKVHHMGSRGGREVQEGEP